MATPIGHALAGYAVYVGGSSSQSRTSILFWFCLLMAIAPDFDFIPGILQGQPNLYHQGVSHSLGAGLFVSFAAALIIGKRKASTDEKTSLNDALRDFQVPV